MVRNETYTYYATEYTREFTAASDSNIQYDLNPPPHSGSFQCKECEGWVLYFRVEDRPEDGICSNCKKKLNQDWDD